MKFFADTSEVDEIRSLNDAGLLDGVTTNPSLIKTSGRNFREVIEEICGIVSGPVSAEVVALDASEMEEEGRSLASIASNVTVKLPLTIDGLMACRRLSGSGIKINVTLCFSANQALLAAKAGASFVSPFIGRLDDIDTEGLKLIEDIRTIYDNYNFSTEILAASIRSPLHIKDCALIGADVATVPPKILWQLAEHPLTQKGLDAFLADWRSTGQSVLRS